MNYSSFERTARTWETWAQKDPGYAILSARGAFGKNWNLNEFFETGREEIESFIEHCRNVGIDLPCGPALDFGCGVGRLSRALALHFHEVVGIDIAPSMIAYAKQYNPGPKFRFLVNNRPDLAIVPDASIDFIYSSLVLQHIAPDTVKRYLAEFYRVLRPEGVMSIHMPSSEAKGAGLKWRVRKFIGDRNYGLTWALLHGTTAVTEMNYIPESEMTDYLRQLGGTVLRVEEILPGPRRQHRRYVVRK
jgi:ubiquinone/menaquinone biosynthesis C-methylase UbiE